jgi:hypothetical protein
VAEDQEKVHNSYDPEKDGNVLDLVAKTLGEMGGASEVKFGNFTILSRQQPRQCSGCTECCTLLGVSAVEKYPGEACRHIAKSKTTGKKICGINRKKPESCQLYQCMWLLGNFSEDYKPSKVGFVVTFSVNQASNEEAKGTIPREGQPYASIQVREQGFVDTNKLDKAVGELYNTFQEVRVIRGRSILCFRDGLRYEGYIIRKSGNYEDLSYAINERTARPMQWTQEVVSGPQSDTII